VRSRHQRHRCQLYRRKRVTARSAWWQHGEEVLVPDNDGMETLCSHSSPQPHLTAAGSDEVEKICRVRCVSQHDADVGIGDAERAQERSEGIGGERRQACQIEATGAEAGDLLDDQPRLLQVAVDLARREHERLPCRREAHAPADPVEQQGPQGSLQLSHGLGHRRLRHPQGVTGPGEPPFVDHCQEDRQTTRIHQLPLIH